MRALRRRIKGIRGFGKRWCLWAKGSRLEGNPLKKVTTLQALTRPIVDLSDTASKVLGRGVHSVHVHGMHVKQREG